MANKREHEYFKVKYIKRIIPIKKHMAIERKVYLCKIPENEELKTKEDWKNKFSITNFKNNLVYYDELNDRYVLVRNAETEAPTLSDKQCYFLIVDEADTLNNVEYVLGSFGRSTKYLPQLIKFETGAICDTPLEPNESEATISRFIFFPKEKVMCYEYNKNGVGFFDHKFYSYLDILFGEDAVTAEPIMDIAAYEETLKRKQIKKLELRVAATNVRFVNKIIGLPISKQFAKDIGEESYNITIIISSNRTSHLGQNFVKKTIDAFKDFRRKEEIKKLEFSPEEEKKHDLTEYLRYQWELKFETESRRSRRITKASFKEKVVDVFLRKKAEILGVIQ